MKILNILFNKTKTPAANPEIKIDSAPEIKIDSAPQLENFDSTFYLSVYPDVAKAGIDPLMHYTNHGKQEGRLGIAPAIEFIGSLDELKSNKETVLIVSHEASLTGAPILSFHLAQQLFKQYNIVVLLLGKGELIESFRAIGAIVAMAPQSRGNTIMAELMLIPLFEKFKFKYALVNSIESRSVLPALTKNKIPSVSLFHEFAAYTPANAFIEAITWSIECVFSTKITRDNLCSKLTGFNPHYFHVLPQGRCIPPESLMEGINIETERVKIKNKIRPQNKQNMFVVLGIGSIQLRKGVDLFIECAARLKIERPNLQFRFVWVGKGYDPEGDLSYSVYLADQIKRANLEEVISIVPESPTIQSAYKHADLFILTSRLDPLPNVAIDALQEGLPVLCFDKTTGIADFLLEIGVGRYCVADYLNPHDMAKKIAVLSDSEKLRREVASQLKKESIKKFNIENYIVALNNLALNARIKLGVDNYTIDIIKQSNLFDTAFFSSPFTAAISEEDAIRYHITSWRAGHPIMRKPYPGFHPGIYREFKKKNLITDPLIDFIHNDQPNGPWLKKVIRPISRTWLHFNSNVALHIHVFYPELFENILNRISANQIHPDLFISVKDEEIRTYLSYVLANYKGAVDVRVVPNRGRDIGPFLTTFGWDAFSGYEFIGHIHTKVSADVADTSMGKIWSTFLLENLIGNNNIPMVDTILTYMMKNKSMGMIYPDDPHIFGWTKNKAFAEILAKKLNLGTLPTHIDFPMGNMFWARTKALQPLFNLKLDWSDYPEEPLPYDGSILHAIERILPLVVESQNMTCAVTHIPGVNR